MSVYLDTAKNQLNRMIVCHMVADTLDELHEMAFRIGLKREWFQLKSVPHYDVSLARRKQAIKLGALELERREFVTVIRRIRVWAKRLATPKQVKDYWLDFCPVCFGKVVTSCRCQRNDRTCENKHIWRRLNDGNFILCKRHHIDMTEEETQATLSAQP